MLSRLGVKSAHHLCLASKGDEPAHRGVDLKLDEMRFAVEHDDNRELVNLILDHPGFAHSDDDSLKTRIAFIALDSTLAEDDVERWVGRN